ncbi:hypothetical protein GJ496_005145 [Pomphorhynchus laevis]|nr:hypothetical protein GJ496_005145 [Pomphorhynchus laevis]
MRVWTSEHIFDHPWESIMKAVAQKYPNPLNKTISAVDLVDRKIENNGMLLKSHRLITCDISFPTWAKRLLGFDQNSYGSELSEIDVEARRMRVYSRNLTFTSNVNADEYIEYFPDPADPNNRTIMKQATVVTVKGVPLQSVMESMISSTMSANSKTGKQSIEWVINLLSSDSKL